MISRYTREKMGQHWSLQAQYGRWLKVELAQAEVLSREGVIPPEAYQTLSQRAAFDAAEIDRIEQSVGHDVIAFLTNVSEKVGPAARYLHFGMTSSDLLDTAFALALTEASDMILEGLDELMSVLKSKAMRYKNLAGVGRSHGVHAEPTVFGLKFTLWYAEMLRNRRRLKEAQTAISIGKFSGAVGTFAYLTPEIEAKICQKLGLKPAPVSTQIIQRDRHAEYFSALAILAGSIEKIALEIRHLQRTEVLEVEEPFSSEQKGSSAMPHKKNPIGSENLTGLSRMIRAYAQAALENIALWHERDISHSSVERIIAPDSTILIDFMLNRLTTILKDLVVHEDRVHENLKKSYGLIHSQRVLLALVQKGVLRQKAYEWVQRNAMLAWKQRSPFLDYLMKDKDIREALTETELRGCFDMAPYLKHVDTIYHRVFKETGC